MKNWFRDAINQFIASALILLNLFLIFSEPMTIFQTRFLLSFAQDDLLMMLLFADVKLAARLNSFLMYICHAYVFTVLLASLSDLSWLTLSWRRPLSYRNQSIDLLHKSMAWFLYDNGLRHERVKSTSWGMNLNDYSKTSLLILTLLKLGMLAWFYVYFL